MKSRLTGFTLLELLVVLVIVGITLSFAVLSLNLRSDKDIVLEESRRLTVLMQLANEEAVIQGRELAMQFEDDTYRFLFLDNKNKWQAIDDDQILRARSLPNGLRTELIIEGIDQASTGAVANVVYFYSSGEITPFQLSMQDNQRKYLYTINGDAQGLIEYTEDEARAG